MAVASQKVLPGWRLKIVLAGVFAQFIQGQVHLDRLVWQTAQQAGEGIALVDELAQDGESQIGGGQTPAVDAQQFAVPSL